jgi:anthranilate/para-aminobenzoate synthase component I
MLEKAIIKCEEGYLITQEPFWSIKFENNSTYIGKEGLSTGHPSWQREDIENPFALLENFWKQNIEGKNEKILVGFIGYDFSWQFEPKVIDSRKTIFPFPVLYFTAYKKSKLCNEPLSLGSRNAINAKSINSLLSDEQYKAMIQGALEQIRAGNIYEINLSKPVLIELSQNIPSEELFAKLNLQNPAPFSALMPLDEQRAICSSSPECFLLKKGPKVFTFPIKGTRRRSNDKAQDANLINELIQSEKERAEHLMVVDLERNDLGRIALPGSVKVEEFLKLSSFKHVHHLISKVGCQLKPDLNIFDVLRATFPSGSVTGAPKIKAMQIIKELEPYPRSAYTGSLGYIDAHGDGQFSVLIRTLLQNGSKLLLNVGGGIVADSEPEFELEETYVKANAFLKLFNKTCLNGLN